MAVDHRTTYCRICEPLCGLIATVDNGRLISLEPDPDNPLSRGQVCPKGIAFTEVQNDPDRILHPLRRTRDGEFEQVTWDQALDEIAARLRTIWKQHGGASIGQYFGNPAGFSYSTALWVGALFGALGAKHQYSPGSQDINSRFVASKLLYGALTQLPFPDLHRTDFLWMLGANPHVSHASGIRAPRVKELLGNIVRRGGRVIVVDPRRTETARAYEYFRVRPDSDAWLLLSMLQVIFAEGLENTRAIADQATGIDFLRKAVRAFAPEQTSEITGLSAPDVRALARDFAAAKSATAYGRTGTCLGRHATLVCYLIDVLSLVTGNLDRPGGTVFSRAAIPLEELAEKSGKASYNTMKSRIGGFPDVLGTFPSAVMADEITTPGEGQLRALFTIAGNPVLSAPDGARLAKALKGLDLHIGLDIYINETNRYADFVLPTTTFLEREDFPFGVSAAMLTPFIQNTNAVVPAYGEAWPEWRILDEIAKRGGFGLFVPGRLGKVLVRMKLTPRSVMEFLLRVGPYGDKFGLRRGGVSPKTLRANPHGVVLSPYPATGLRTSVVKHPRHLVRLDPQEIVEELGRLGDRHVNDEEYPLRMIGLREIRSHNSWMHNSPTLMRGERRKHVAHLNPTDAATAGVGAGDEVRITSRHGQIVTVARLTDDVGPGTVAVPHGWGHAGGWKLANAAGGVNTNSLASSDPTEVERLAGMSHLNGIAVRIDVVNDAATPHSDID